MTFPQLETERLLLTEVKEQNASDIFEIFSNPQVVKYYGMDAFENPEQAKQLVQHFLDNFAGKRGIRWAIILKGENKFVGTIGLNNLLLRGKKAEVGFEIHPDFWRTGITSEALKTVLAYSFHQLNLHRIGAVTFPENFASINLLNRIGFQEEGKLRNYLFQNGESHDALIFSIVKSEWFEKE